MSSTDPMDRDTPEWVRSTNPLTLSEEEYLRWLQASRRGIGGSNAATLIGANRWATPDDVYDRILRLAPDITNADMKRGLALEPHAIQVYADRTGRKITEAGFIRDPDKPWIVGHPDGYIEGAPGLKGRGILEIKCPRLDGYHRVRTEGIDPSYYCQIQWYMGITGLKWGSFGIFSGEEWDIYWFDVMFDAELYASMVEAADRFWHEHILTRQRPSRLTPVLTAQIPVVGNESVALSDPEHIAALNAYVEAKRAEKAAKEAVKNAQDRMQAIIDELDAGMVHYGKIKIHYKYQEGARYIDVEALLRDHPDIDASLYERRRSPSRPFRAYGI